MDVLQRDSSRIVTLRSSDGVVYTDPLRTGLFDAESQYRIMLIHGFKNSEADAYASYERFRSTLAKLDDFLAQKLFYVVWRGDEYANLQQWFSKNVDNAAQSGKNLARLLRSLMTTPAGRRCQLVIVAHSLGCWLTAETIKELHRTDPDLCRSFKLFLMAGAVRSTDVDDVALFGAPLAATSSVINMYSPKDGVLHYLFRSGLRADGRAGGQAIGLTGAPRSFGSWQSEHMANFVHENYWQREAVVELVARLLGRAVPIAVPTTEPPTYEPPEYYIPEFDE